MGNMCFGNKKPKKPSPGKSALTDPKSSPPGPNPKDPSPQKPPSKTNAEDIDSPVPEEVPTPNQRVSHPTESSKQPLVSQEASQKRIKISEKETNVSKNDYSFAKVTRTGDNKFSFEVYGEDISALNPKFLLDNLGNISHTSKINISRNDLLLLTEENQEILKFLSANNITHRDLVQGIRKEHGPGSMALDEKLRITGTMIQNEQNQYGLPEHLRLKYMKLVNQNPNDPASQSNLSTINNMSTNNQASSVNNNDPNQNLIKDESWRQDMNIQEDQNKFLQIKQRFFLDFDIWDSEQHEIILRDLLKAINRDYNQEMRDHLRHYKPKLLPYTFPDLSKNYAANQVETTFNQNRSDRLKTLLTEDPAFKVMDGKPRVSHLYKEAFLVEYPGRMNNFLTALSCIINSDIEFQTNSLRRLVYPHLNNFPSHSPENVYFVKLFVNGVRRCVPLNGQFDSGFYYTTKKELYPLFIQKGLQQVYPKDELTEVLPNYLLYRMIGWIPEILVFSDIGSCEQSYEKLKESFLSFSVMLSFDYEGDIVPILEFVDGSNGRGMKVRTILPRKYPNFDYLNKDYFPSLDNGQQNSAFDQNSSNRREQSTSEPQRDITQLLDWRELYNSNQLKNIYISWNPSIHSCRKMIHFNVFPQPISSESIFDNSLFNSYKKVQILISLSPHNEPNETRLILEKHKVRHQKVLYEIRYNLYAFNRHRILLPSECFKNLEIREDESNDVINDTMIFEQNNIQDNYILTIEAIPLGHLANVFPEEYEYRNPEDDVCKVKAPRQGKKYIDCDVDDFGVPERWPEEIVMSLNIYAWYETEIMEIPFKEVTQMFKMSLGELSDQKFKLKILKPCDIEIRIEGGIQYKFAVKISKFSRYRNSYRDGDGVEVNGGMNQTKNVYLVQNNSARRKANSLRFRAKEGTFLVNFGKKLCGKKDNGYEPEVEERLLGLYGGQQHENVMITILSFGDELHRTFKQSMNRIKNSTPYRNKTKAYKIESRHSREEFFNFEMPQKGGLKFSRTMEWDWNSQNNFGDNKFGIATFQKFHQNPGFLVNIKEDCQVQVEVLVENYKHEKCGYKLNIFEISDAYVLENILDYDEFHRDKRLTTDILFLSKNKNGYLFLMVAMYSDFRSTFSMNIQSDLELLTMRKNTSGICKLPWVEKFPGSIEPNTGGWIKMYNFLLNQSFIIIVGEGAGTDSQEIFIELTSSNKTQHIGVSIIPLSSLKNLCYVDESEIEAVNTNPAFLAEMNAYYLQIPQGTYMVVPTSFEPLERGERLDYELKIFSSIGFKFKKMNAYKPRQEDSQIITMVDQVIFQLEVFTEKAEVMVIVESLESDNENIQVLDFIAESKKTNKMNYRKTVNLERESFYHKMLPIEAMDTLTLAFASKIDRWLKFNLIVFSNVADSFRLTKVVE